MAVLGKVYSENCLGEECNNVLSPNFESIVAKKCLGCRTSYYVNIQSEREKEKARIHEDLKTHTHLATDNRRGLELTAYMYILDFLVDIKDELVELNKKVVIKN